MKQSSTWLLLILIAHPLFAAPTTQAIALNCINCHSHTNKTTSIPDLSGYPRVRFIQHMRAFKTGNRSATIMHHISQAFSEQQIIELAQYFEKQK